MRTVKECLAYLLECFSYTEAKDWVFVSQAFGEDLEVIFKDPKTGKRVGVIENKTGDKNELTLCFYNDREERIKREDERVKIYEENEVKTDLLRTMKSSFEKYWDQLSGRLVYQLGMFKDENPYAEVPMDRLLFCCGPETTMKTLFSSESGEFNDCLRELFSDMPEVEIGVAENIHGITCKSKREGKKIWEVVEKRLISSGAEISF